jgi:O-antigen/teichoic acid export membrane protein
VKILDTILVLLLTLAALGMPSAAARFVPEVQQPQKQGLVLTHTLLLALLGAVASAAIVYVLLPGIFLDPRTLRFSRWIIWLLIPLGLTRTLLGFFQGQKRIRFLAGANVSVSVVTLSLVVLSTWRWELSGWVVGRFLGDGLATLALLVLAARQLVLGIRWNLLKRIFVFGWFAGLSLLVSRMIYSMDILYLDRLKGDPWQTGCYGLASSLVLLVLLLPSAIGIVVLPDMAERCQEPRASFRIATKAIVNALVAVVLVAAGLFLLAPSLLPLVFGRDYYFSSELLRILLLGTLFYVPASILGTHLFALGQSKITFPANLLVLAVNLGANVVLIPEWGARGAATAMVMTHASLLVVYLGLTFAVLNNVRLPFLIRLRISPPAREEALSAQRSVNGY